MFCDIRANVSEEEQIHTSSMRQARKMAQMSMVSDDKGMILLNQDLFSPARVFSLPIKI